LKLGEEDSQALAGEQQRGTQSRVGSLVRGKYRIEEFISKGSMAAVYAASHRNGTKVALKVLHAVYSKDESLRTRFLREGYLANSVDHPGTVKVVDDDVTEDGCVFLVMELLKGETLEQWRVKSGGRAPLEEAMAVADQLLAVLEAAHKKGIVHRDLKPENIFVTDEGTLKVLDWGVANVWDGQKSSEMTGTGMVLGTPAFMPPEQALGKRNEVDAQSDLWAIGATLFMLLSGESVHPGGDAVAKLVATARKPARSLRTLAPDLPPAVISAVDKSLAFKKTERWANATVMRQAFADALPQRHYGDNQDDEPTLFARRSPSDDADDQPNTERHLQAAGDLDDAFDALERLEEQGPITLDRPTERGRKEAQQAAGGPSQKPADKGRKAGDSAPPLTQAPITRAPQTSPMPLAAISLPTPGSGFEPKPNSTARMPMQGKGPHPLSTTAAMPPLGHITQPPPTRPPMSSSPGSAMPSHHPMSTPLSTAQPIASSNHSSAMIAPALSPSELAGLPIPSDHPSNTSNAAITGAHTQSSGRGKGFLLVLASVFVLAAGVGLVFMQKRHPIAGGDPLAGTGTTSPALSSAAVAVNTPSATTSAAPPTSVAAVDAQPSAAIELEAVADAGAPSTPLTVASLEQPQPRPRPRPRPQPSATVAPPPDNTDTAPTTTAPTTATPPTSASPDPTTPTKIPDTPPAKSADPAAAKTADPAPAKSADPAPKLPEKIPTTLPDDPN